MMRGAAWVTGRAARPQPSRRRRGGEVTRAGWRPCTGGGHLL